LPIQWLRIINKNVTEGDTQLIYAVPEEDVLG